MFKIKFQMFCYILEVYCMSIIFKVKYWFLITKPSTAVPVCTDTLGAKISVNQE